MNPRASIRRLGAVVLTLILVAGLLGGTVPVAAQQSGPPDFVEVLVGGPGAAGAVGNSGGRITHQFTNFPVVLASLPERALEGLGRAPGVTFIEENGEMWAIQQTVPWGISRIGAPDAWSASAVGTGIRLAVLDTGIDGGHDDLQGNVVAGTNTVDSTSPLLDSHGHGTHVAGTAGALNNTIGVVGVAPKVTLVAVKVLDASGSGSWASVAAGIDWSISNNIQVINMSLGGGASETVRLAVESAWSSGLLLVAAAGNSGNAAGRGDNVNYPAAYDQVIAVAASDSQDGRASFSSTGPAVELIAPGVSILSTLPGDKYGTMSGTSMSSPHVAGAAALAWAVNPELSNAQLRQILRDTAEDLGLRADHQGYGLVRADLAVAAVGGVEPPATGSIQGTVTASDGAAIAGATVTATTGGSNFSTTTGTDGSYLLSTIPVGAYDVTASKTGYVNQTSSTVNVDTDTTVTVSFTLTAETTPSGTVTVNSVAYSTSGGRYGDKHLSVTIALVNDSGNPVGGASVQSTLMLGSNTSWSFSGTTESGGTVTFSLNNAPSGTYTTTVTFVTAAGLTWDGVTPDNSFVK